MGKDPKRFWLVVILCGISGMLMGATTSQATINECLTDSTPSQSCLTQDPNLLKVESVAMGLLAGVGAAFGATWQATQEK